MKITFSGDSVKGAVYPPASKSHTHRALFLAGMASGTSRISNALISADTKATLRSIQMMGAQVDEDNGTLVITGGKLHAPNMIVDADNSGTTMRLLTGISSMFSETVTITGDDSLRKRPMTPLLDALSDMGVICTSNDGKAPVSVKGPNKGGNVSIDGSVSSQFISSLMMVAPMLENDICVSVKDKLVSRPYLDITAHMMGGFGSHPEVSDSTIKVRGGTGYSPIDMHIPSDFSSAAFPLVAGALGGCVSVKGMDMSDPQGDRIIVDILKEVGAKVTIEGGTITAERKELKAMDIDMGKCPDLFPIIAVLLSTAEGESRLYGAPQLRFKESDRIESVTRMLTALGADIEGTDDGCVIKGKKGLIGGEIDNVGDHRIMMAAAVSSLVCEGTVSMEDPECCAVSYPMFPDHMKELGMKVE